MNNSEIKEIVNSTIQVLEENSWTKEVCARDKDGKHVYVHSPTACSFCLMGALLKAEDNWEKQNKVCYKLSNFIVERRGFNQNISSVPIIAFNDACETKEEIIKLLQDFHNSLGE